MSMLRLDERYWKEKSIVVNICLSNKCTSPSVFNTYDRVRKAATLMDGVESEDKSCRKCFFTESAVMKQPKKVLNLQLDHVEKPVLREKLKSLSEWVRSFDQLYQLA